MHLHALFHRVVASKLTQLRNTPQQPIGLFVALTQQRIEVEGVERLEDMSQQVPKTERLPFGHRRPLEDPRQLGDAADPSLVEIVKQCFDPATIRRGLGKRAVLEADRIDQRLEHRLLVGLAVDRTVTLLERSEDAADGVLSAWGLVLLGCCHGCVTIVLK